MDAKSSKGIIVGMAVVLIVLLVVVAGFIYRDFIADSDGDEMVEATATVESIAEVTAVVPTATPVSNVVVEIATLTPIPTAVFTATPVPTDTPVPTETPLPTATNTPAPVIIYPTATPVPPTATPVPPPTGPQPSVPNGIRATHYALQDRSNISVNGKIWFEFVIVNEAGYEVPYSALGTMPRKDGVDRLEWYQNSWGGNDDVMPLSGRRWEDNIKIPEAGDYTLRLVICFESKDVCRSGNGTFHTLSQEIPVTLN